MVIAIPWRRKFQFSAVGYHMYAIGERIAIVQACKTVFDNLGWATTEKKGTILCYPSGMLDRVNSALTKFGSVGFNFYFSDMISITYRATDNPAVTLLHAQHYMKINRHNERQKKERIQLFWQSFANSLATLKIPVIQDYDWPKFIVKHPKFRCEPNWPQTRP